MSGRLIVIVLVIVIAIWKDISFGLTLGMILIFLLLGIKPLSESDRKTEQGVNIITILAWGILAHAIFIGTP